MELKAIKTILQCQVLTDGLDMNMTVDTVLASDGMSEILAFAKSRELMITGLTNILSIRTADIAGVAAVLYCRGKSPEKKSIAFAREKGIPVLVTKWLMFDICGVLHAKGLKGAS